MLLMLMVILVWGGFFYFHHKTDEIKGKEELQENRFMDLLAMAGEYRARTGDKGPEEAGIPGGDPVELISEALEILSLKQNLLQLSVSSSGVTLQLKDLYGDQMMNLLDRITRAGLDTDSLELRAVNTESGRLLDLSLIVVKRE